MENYLFYEPLTKLRETIVSGELGDVTHGWVGPLRLGVATPVSDARQSGHPFIMVVTLGRRRHIDADSVRLVVLATIHLRSRYGGGGASPCGMVRAAGHTGGAWLVA